MPEPVAAKWKLWRPKHERRPGDGRDLLREPPKFIIEQKPPG
jgi:hypothetical protein